jgi:subtilisin family serine protease
MFLLCLFGSVLAAAQVGLPPVRVPLPGTTLPGIPATDLAVDQRLDAELRNTDLRDLRTLRIRALLRSHRDLIEADTRGNPIVRGEVLAVAPTSKALAAAAAAGFTVVRESNLGTLDLRIVVLRAASGTAHSLAQLQAGDPTGVYDFNHLYIESGVVVPADAAAAQAVTAHAESAGPSTLQRARVGLIDTGVDAAHEVFRDATVHQHGCTGRVIPHEHGTAVASLLVGRAPTFNGAAPGGELYAADVFCGLPTGGATTEVAEAFAWLVQQEVPVINVSLVGPPNRLLEVVVQHVIASGHVIVAAVGNDGPAAGPLYPAAWPGVVGVTGVDAQRRVLIEAERGPQVKFAAPGAQLAAAKSPSGYVVVRGTSFAAPLVAGLLALGLPAPAPAAAADAINALTREATHLGSGTPNPVYGFGLVGEALRRQPVLATLRAK